MTAAEDGQLVPEDLIQDSEVGGPEDDQLAHLHLAEQLQHLALSVPTPTNIAVWGPWGSGKSGVANLLKGCLDRRAGTRFVRFDAFKYAENPLRRNFISAVAGELGIYDPEFHTHLYSGKVTAEFSFTRRHAWQLLWMYVRMFSLVCGVALGVVALLVWAKGGPFWPGFAAMASGAMKAGLAPAALLTSLAVLVSRTLTTEHKVDAAHSDEEFERIFDELVSMSRVQRLVVFVDELDRCAPRDVVATLDALRTFLGVRRCVFIVAADQQVLERALTEALEQATPVDSVNPYYSSGSGYLDKVFQYQISMPPLLVPQVTRFAAGLVTSRGGVWGEIDIDLVVSILVPSHVRSPRRVKALLNAFALTYRLAQQRQAAGLLDTVVAERADEIARLVCLRVEFPLFSRDLLLDHRMPQHVLALAEDEDAELGSYVPGHVRQAALRYATGKAPVDQNLTDRSRDTDGADAVRGKQGQQLLDYLARTRMVSGPQRDLVFMQTSGSVVGLASALAETLEQHAQNAALGQLEQVLEDLSVEDRQAALSLLIQQVRAAMGIEAWNVVQSVLLMCCIEGVNLAERADAALGVITPTLLQHPHELPTRVLAGAWQLALASSREGADQLAARVLQHPALEEQPELVAIVLRDVPAALAADAERVVGLLCEHLLSDTAEETAATLSRLKPGDAEHLMAVLAPALAKELRTVIEESTETAALPAPEGGNPGAQPRALSALESLVRAWAPRVPKAAHAVLALLLELDHQNVDDVIEDLLEQLPKVSDFALSQHVLARASRRHFSAWPRWMDLLHPSGELDHLAPAIATLLHELWRDASSTHPEATEHIDQIATSYLRLVGDLPQGAYPDLTEPVISSLGSFAGTDTEASERMRVLVAARPFLDNGLLDRIAYLRHEATALVSTLTSPCEEVPASGSPLLRYLTSTVGECLDGFDRSSPHPLPSTLVQDLLHAIDACAWIPEPDRTTLVIAARSSVRELPAGIKLAALPTSDVMATFARTHPTHEAPALAGWIRLSRPSAPDMLTVLTPLTTRGRPQPDRAMMRVAGDRLSHLSLSERMLFWQGLIGGNGPSTPSRTLLRDLGWSRLPDSAAVEVLISRYETSTNQVERDAVLTLWQQADISSGPCRRRLIEKIMLPLLTTNQTAAQSALQALPKLAEPIPQGTRKALRDAVVVAAQRWSKLGNLANRTMKELGYDLERRGLFGNRQKIKEVPAD
ncbi:KAP family P-loop NTPase fold protein [Streptomyces sp. NPDC004838]